MTKENFEKLNIYKSFLFVCEKLGIIFLPYFKGKLINFSLLYERGDGVGSKTLVTFLNINLVFYRNRLYDRFNIQKRRGGRDEKKKESKRRNT